MFWSYFSALVIISSKDFKFVTCLIYIGISHCEGVNDVQRGVALYWDFCVQ